MAPNQATEGTPMIGVDYENPFISPRTKNFYLNTDSADVHFICDGSNGERIPAHKVIMSVASDAFNAMFHSGLREPGDIRIVDASAAGFKEFLKLFYFDKITPTMEHIAEVVYLCAKYVYSSSLRICERFLLDSLSIENVCFSYGLAIAYDLVELKQKCKEMITVNAMAIFQTNGFLDCDRSVLAEILQFDRLSCTEIDLFMGCMAWVKVAAMDEQVTRQLIDEQLGDSFRDIRFGSMTDEHLTGLLSHYGSVFSVDEYQEIVQLIASKDFHSTLFKEELRLFPWNKDDAIKSPWKCVSDYTSWKYLHEFESTTFSTAKRILLGEIVLKRFWFEESPMELLILEKSVVDGEGRKSRIVHQQQVELNESHKGICITLQKALILSPNFKYEIQLKMSSSPRSDNKYWTDLDVLANMKKHPDHNIIKIHNLSDKTLINSLNFNIIPSKYYRLF